MAHSACFIPLWFFTPVQLHLTSPRTQVLGCSILIRMRTISLWIVRRQGERETLHVREEENLRLNMHVRNSVIELNYIQTGLAWIKLGDVPFSSLSAGRDILESARSFMEQNDGWVSYGAS